MRIKQLIKNQLIDKFVNLSFSQEGEDLILARYFENKAKGFFIDIGAHHPKKYSNTYKFYKTGWRGINVDAMPGSMEVFKAIRPDDINLEVPVSDVNTTLTYFIFNETALNTLDPDEAKLKNEIDGYNIVREVELETVRLEELLSKYLPNNITQIDFLTVDVEGLDLQVLKSNDWIKYRPELVLVEELRADLETVMLKSPVFAYMKEQEYSLICRSYNTSFYRANN
jgi:FkbM family methyltransferase